MIVTWNSAKAKKIAREAAMKALIAGAEAIMTEAIDQAPLDTATLRRSGTVSVGALADQGSDGRTVTLGSDPVVYISFNTPYASRQHEEMDYAHPRGGNAKYLENPFNANADKVVKLAELSVKDALEGAK